MHKLLKPKIIFFHIYKRNFCATRMWGLWMGQIIALPPKFAFLAVDNKVIYQCKRGLFVEI